MRVTNSVDGVKRINLRIVHRVGAVDLANALCLLYKGHDPEKGSFLPDLSREKIVDVLRGALKHRADDINWWADEVEDDIADELREWAAALVREKFPELH